MKNVWFKFNLWFSPSMGIQSTKRTLLEHCLRFHVVFWRVWYFWEFQWQKMKRTVTRSCGSVLVIILVSATKRPFCSYSYIITIQSPTFKVQSYAFDCNMCLTSWIVLFAHADWIAWRWLAKYYSPPSSQRKTNYGFCLYIVTKKVTLWSASYSACVVYTKTIVHLSVGESGGFNFHRGFPAQ